MRRTVGPWLGALGVLGVALGCGAPEPVSLERLEDAPGVEARVLLFEGTPQTEYVGVYRWRSGPGEPKPTDLEYVVPVVSSGWTTEQEVPLYLTPPSNLDGQVDAWLDSLPAAFEGKRVQGRVLYAIEQDLERKPVVRWEGAVEDARVRHGVRPARGAPVVVWPEPVKEPATTEDIAIGILTVLGMLAMVGFGVAFTVHLWRQRDESLADALAAMAPLAKRHGLAMRRDDGLNHKGAVYEGMVDGIPVEIRLRIDGRVTSSLPAGLRITLLVKVPVALGVGLRLRPAGLVATLGTAMTGDPVTTGERAFDEAFVVRATDVDGARRALTTSARQAMLTLSEADLGELSVNDEGLWLQMGERGAAEVTRALELGCVAVLGLRDGVLAKHGGEG